MFKIISAANPLRKDEDLPQPAPAAVDYRNLLFQLPKYYADGPLTIMRVKHG
jgi:hypothetical protein